MKLLSRFLAVGALLIGVLYSGLFFLRMGTTGLTAQSYGRRSVSELRAWLARALLLAAALGVLGHLGAAAVASSLSAGHQLHQRTKRPQ